MAPKRTCKACVAAQDAPGADLCVDCFDLDQRIRRSPDAAYALLRSLAPTSPLMTTSLRAIRHRMQAHPLPWGKDAAGQLIDAQGQEIGIIHDATVAAAVIDLINLLPDLQGK